MMIHNCMSYLGYANSNEMRKAAEDNDKINQSAINAYLTVSNLPEDEIRKMMDDATWLTAQECLKYGFATEVADLEEDDAEVQQSAFHLIREAVLKNQEKIDLSPIMQRLEAIEKAIQKDDGEDPDEDDEKDPDKEEDPDEDDEKDPDEDDKKEEQSAFNKFISFLA